LTVVDWLVVGGVLIVVGFSVVGFSVVGGVFTVVGFSVVGFSVVGFSVIGNAFTIGGLLARDKNDSTTMVLYHEMTFSSFF
jgi:hypothetical protein